MSGANESPLEYVSRVMRRLGARRVVFKLLANNDNSKQQIYFGSDFDVLRLIPHGDLVGETTKDKGLMYKASLKLSWIDIESDAPPSPAPGAQLIFYPRYPEVRMSGFLRGSALAPSKLMRPPTPEERSLRERTQRCLVLGICNDDTILAYSGVWDGRLARDANARIGSGKISKVATVFYELERPVQQGRILLLEKLSEIYHGGFVRSGRLNSAGALVEYHAKNGAGYTLESLFGIVPNGRSEPDFHEWELKSHRSGAVTLMTPEPDSGTYRANLKEFLLEYGNCTDARRDFTGRHLIGIPNARSGLMLRMEGYDPEKNEVLDPSGGLVMRNAKGEVALGWTFNKILTHWSRKHAQTAYVAYKVEIRDVNYYQFGPEVFLCSGADLGKFLKSMYEGLVYHDPGINMKLVDGQWKSKKRNQFRVAWKNIGDLYEVSERMLLTDLY
ncbi:MvaI/BcnI family restriction endonuclease [Pseudomonas helmanticensis]|uniref:MvaI/BcnI family restriction endonuclease n=1 Tax=Pseudomonas helmanticensis TaxID=1471381 RepID=UPI0038020673